jgi:solute:Na+ symporter, SSS family
MLLPFVILFLFINLLVGVAAVRYVKTSGDFMLAGRRLPLSMATFTVFATWFGSETLFGASAAFSDGGFLAVIEDPFGGMLCLVLVGALFARQLYRHNYLTLGDLFRDRFGAGTELVASIVIVFSFFGWIAAQMVALGIAINLVAGLDFTFSIVIASGIVIAYTFMGGMWSVSITDTIQTVFIIIGLLIVALMIFPQAGGIQTLIAEAPEGFFRIIPKSGSDTLTWLEYTAAWITLGLGSIPSQDIFQRVMSSKSSTVASRSSLIAGLMYITIGMIPLFLAMAALKILPDSPEDQQMLLPMVVMQYTPPWVQVLFFGAVMAAIMSTASGATIAPASVLSENIIRRWIRKPLSDWEFLWINRISVLFISAMALLLALSKNNIYELVAEAASVGLVALFVPMVMGLFTDAHSEKAGLCAIASGFFVWLLCYFWIQTQVPAIFYGLAASALGYILGMLAHRLALRFRSDERQG